MQARIACRPNRKYPARVALIRILVDGYSLLHGWPGLAPGRARHSAAAREALVRKLTHYQDATGVPITVFFDGAGAPPHAPKPHHGDPVEVLFSRNGQTADQMIERAVHRFQDYGEVLAITDDRAERHTVAGLGGLTDSCANFIATIGETLGGLSRDLHRHNHKEHHRFRSTARTVTRSAP